MDIAPIEGKEIENGITPIIGCGGRLMEFLERVPTTQDSQNAIEGAERRVRESRIQFQVVGIIE